MSKTSEQKDGVEDCMKISKPWNCWQSKQRQLWQEKNNQKSGEHKVCLLLCCPKSQNVFSAAIPRIRYKPYENVRILKLDLKLFPYRIQVKHNQQQKMKKHELTCATGLTTRWEENEEWIDNVWFSNEAHFHLNGYINFKNNVITARLFASSAHLLIVAKE